MFFGYNWSNLVDLVKPGLSKLTHHILVYWYIGMLVVHHMCTHSYWCVYVLFATSQPDNLTS